MKEQAATRLGANDPSWAYRVMELKDTQLRRLFDDLLMAFRPSVICDIGSYDGQNAVRWANLIPTSHVVSFEANPVNIERFWPASDHVRDAPALYVEAAAVGGVDGERDFWVLDAREDEPWRDGAASLLQRCADIGSTSIRVPGITLDGYFSDKHADANSFALSVEVEGSASEVLGGADHVLSRTCLIRVQLEREAIWAEQKLADDVLALLDNRGFVRIGSTWEPNAYTQGRELFLRKDLMELIPAATPA